MNADKDLSEAALTEGISGPFCAVDHALGPGLRQSVYENTPAIARQEASFPVARQDPDPVTAQHPIVGPCRADRVVDEPSIPAIKAATARVAAHAAQSRNDREASSVEIGLLLNFAPQAALKRKTSSNKNPRSPASSAPSALRKTCSPRS